MSRDITIIEETIDGDSVKSVNVNINGIDISEYYSYPVGTEDVVILSDVDADLTEKGYTE